MTLTRRQTIGGALTTGALATGALIPTPSRAKPRDRRPNVVFIMADDLGYADLSCYGRRDFTTPHLDRLAREGLRYTSAYANSSVCSATRTALITGRYQYRIPLGLEEPLAARDVGLPPEHPTLPSLLRDVGYATALIGKWHMGTLPKYGPLKSGYDRFWGIRGGGVDYFTHGHAAGHDLWDGDVHTQQVGYLTDLIADRAIDTIGDFAKGEKPFLLSLHFTAPHWPWEGPDDKPVSDELSARRRDPYTLLHFDGGTQAIYAAMVTRMDAQIGRVLAALRRHGLDRNTIVVFTSDNGGERFSDVWPFSGRKTELLEGGLRVPAIVRWPGRIRGGQVNDTPIMSIDWLPTFLAAAGARQAADFPSDGLDLAATFTGGILPERPLYWRYRRHAQRAMRQGRFKYLKMDDNEFLFDVVADPLERGNLKTRQPERFAAMKAAWEGWEKTMLPIDPNAYSHHFRAQDMADRYDNRE